ncbi:dipeptidase [Hoyosella subflava]|uniref:Putative dipeptidase n=1 Tax=Hoyosella subflava (strain DSM 45089 / JCM 17490 / NBRC 109087 / DQS3-9A1) TaxID=443218 RepID=F6EKQ0_HOYSD|nr:membrane dipeptidase [Hoyosella subflava]AEF40186.1 Putative dipeptidase [Hoyosella subflava DQS3-9A1]
MSRKPWRVSDEVLTRAVELNRDSLTVDMHTHGRSIVPEALRMAAERVFPVPRDPLANLAAGAVNVAVVTAIGDPIGTAWRPRSAWSGVREQLARARGEGADAAISVITEAVSLPAADSTVIVLGVEGSDVVGDDPSRLSELHEMGVRLLGLVHYRDNGIGTISTSLAGKRGSRAVRSGRRTAGLTPLGREVISEMNRLGMVVDLAHADRATTIAACEQSNAPVISSHTAAASVKEFPRYIGDDEAEAIADTGGLVGLWPMRLRDAAMVDLDDFARHASHLADLIGPEHLCIGTDMNGVVSYAHGFGGSKDFPMLAAALLQAGFASGEVAAILGANAQRVLAKVLSTGNGTP